MTLEKVFKTPSQAVLNGSILQKPILVFMDQFENYFLQSVGQQLVMIFNTLFNKEIGLKSAAVSGEGTFGMSVM